MSDQNQTPPEAARSHRLARPVVFGLMAALIAVCALGGSTLYREYALLRQELEFVRRSAVIGYPGITPVYCYAERPKAWILEEGNSTRIWAGWKDGKGHLWFRAGRGDVDLSLMSVPIGRDVIQAIDSPLTEGVGGVIWERIPDDAYVAAPRLGGVDTAYPLLVLDKVFVVNDTIGGEPYLVTCNPTVPEADRVAVYETRVDGNRVTMGLTGYFLGSHPLLYDRGTESLWVNEAGALRAVAGAHKGQHLRRVSQPALVSWRSWRTGHPDGRLVIGADRSRPRPQL